MPCPKDTKRTDISGRAHAGSQRQIQTYVNERTSELNQKISDALSQGIRASNLRWISPLAADGYSEYRDAEFLQLIGAGHLASMLPAFWPRGGPCWDALARIDGGGCILLEAKSHVPEIYGNGCQASGDSLRIITTSLDRTKSWLGVRPEALWLGPLYQCANRLAHLYFLREVGKLDAFLVNVYFIDDPHSRTTSQQWDEGISLANQALGIGNQIPYTGSVFLTGI